MDFWNELIQLMKMNREYLEKQGPPRPGLVPKSGNPQHPYRWVKPAEQNLPARGGPPSSEGLSPRKGASVRQYRDQLKRLGYKAAGAETTGYSTTSWLKHPDGSVIMIDYDNQKGVLDRVIQTYGPRRGPGAGQIYINLEASSIGGPA